MASETFRPPHDPCPPSKPQLRRSLHDFASALRAELGWTLRDKFYEPAGIYIPDDDNLKAELSNIRYKVRSDGKRQLEDKAETKKRLNGRSPDRFDAMMMSYASPNQGGNAASVGKHSLWD